MKAGASQTERFRALFVARAGQWISLREILDLRIGQYNARILELRREYNMDIENEMTVVDGVRHSRYRYLPRAKQEELFKGAA